jgi:hypothetical protein
MNCALCLARDRAKNACDGCRSERRFCSRHCRIDLCEKRTGRFCFNCPEFPCLRLRNLDKRYRTRYGMSMIANLTAIQTGGIRRFVKAERTKWTCPACDELLCVHRPACPKCGRKRTAPIEFPAVLKCSGR